MPGAYTDDGSAKGAAALGRVPWFARMPRDSISLSDYMGMDGMSVFVGF